MVGRCPRRRLSANRRQWRWGGSHRRVSDHRRRVSGAALAPCRPPLPVCFLPPSLVLPLLTVRRRRSDCRRTGVSQRLLSHLRCFAPSPFPPPRSGTRPPPPPHGPDGGRRARRSLPLPRRHCDKAPGHGGTEWVAAVSTATVAAPGPRNTPPPPPAVPLTAGARASGADRPPARRAHTPPCGLYGAGGRRVAPTRAPGVPAGAHLGCARRGAPCGGTAGPPCRWRPPARAAAEGRPAVVRDAGMPAARPPRRVSGAGLRGPRRGPRRGGVTAATGAPQGRARRRRRRRRRWRWR